MTVMFEDKYGWAVPVDIEDPRPDDPTVITESDVHPSEWD
jgi:hypothetical protein